MSGYDRYEEYDFDKIVDRRHSGSMKWDVAENELPMWVADMDFQTAPQVRQAIARRAAHGVFGYTIVPDEWYQAYMHWWKTRHSLEIQKDWLIFCTGVVPAISSMVRKLTTPAEKVLIQTPVYNIFFNSILNNGRVVLESPLVYRKGAYEAYEIDFEDLEEKLADPQTTLMILCNPHNPVGKIWDARTLERIGELCWKHHVCVISDEIHCDLTAPGCSYVPFASVSEKCRENSITCIAPTKAFNMAGLQTAAVSVPNPVLRHKVWRGLNTDEVAEPNAFAIDAAVAAFTEGGEWLDALRGYIFENKRLVEEYVAKEIPGVSVVPSQATYLSWLDCSALPAPAEELAAFIREKTGLYLSSGEQYGGQGKRFLRLNAACPRSVLQDGLDRLKRGIADYQI
ncbi:MAG TPA: pyridoxal phosphate-dependent aminotransferase [Candidatus Eisenbergiella merdavium]|uniref:cysteine-S-conjugate beta-lyase n=1 Tax=Candidatus Eisenbergiella merdavium TaxID=2838551 RepID=A0A9D2NFF9_9FIRM|nr:pyridoxal phosphate-dependent aminotransferase [Candidatus Eisenbergiella merdavium]